MGQPEYLSYLPTEEAQVFSQTPLSNHPGLLARAASHPGTAHEGAGMDLGAGMRVCGPLAVLLMLSATLPPLTYTKITLKPHC